MAGAPEANNGSSDRLEAYREGGNPCPEHHGCNNTSWEAALLQTCTLSVVNLKQEGTQWLECGELTTPEELSERRTLLQQKLNLITT